MRRLANRAFYVSVRRLHFDIVVTFPGGTPSVWSGISIQAASGLSSGREKPNHWYASNIPRPSDDTHPTPEVFLPHARLAGSITLAPAIQCCILLELSGKQCGTALLLRLSDASHAQALRQFESAYHCIIACLTVSRTRHTESLSRSRSSSARIQNPAGSTSPCDSGSVGDYHNLGECNSKVQDGMTSSVSRVPFACYTALGTAPRGRGEEQEAVASTSIDYILPGPRRCHRTPPLSFWNHMCMRVDGSVYR